MRLTGLIFSPLLLVTCYAPASAAGAPGISVSVRPCDATGRALRSSDYFAVTARAGTSKELHALFANVSKKPTVVAIAPVDAATALGGGISAKLNSDRRSQVGSWLHLHGRSVKLAAVQSKIIDFTLHIPLRAHSGQYVGALTVLASPRRAKVVRKFAVTVQTRLAIPVMVTIPGPKRWGFSVQGVDWQRTPSNTFLRANIRNSGNMLLKGTCYLRVWQWGRKQPIVARRLILGTTLAGDTAHYPIAFGQHPRIGGYSYTLTAQWHGGRDTKRGVFHIRAGA